MNQSELFILIFDQSQAAFLRANEYQLSDCAKYFLEHVTRLGQHGYIPTTQDILHTRVRTSGIVEVKFHIKVTSRDKDCQMSTTNDSKTPKS